MMNTMNRVGSLGQVRDLLSPKHNYVQLILISIARLTGTCGSFQLDRVSLIPVFLLFLSLHPAPFPLFLCLKGGVILGTDACSGVRFWVSAKRLQIMLSVTEALETQHIHHSVVEETVLFRYKYQR